MSGITSLVISRFAPDRAAGGAALRNQQNIRALARLGPVDVLSIGEDVQAATAVEGVREWRHICLPARTDRWQAKFAARRWWLSRDDHPLMDRYDVAEARRWLDDRLRRMAYHWVVVEELALARYAELCRKRHCRVVFDAHNVEGTLRAAMASAGARQDPLRRWEARTLAERLGREERRAIGHADLVWACSARDARELAALYGANPVVVPNGVDVGGYRPSLEPAGDWTDKPVTLVFIGSFNYLPNEDAALRLIREVLPAVRHRRPDARLALVGRGPTAAMHAAAAGDPGIVISGPVASVLPYLHREAVSVVPLTLGSGTRLKILEAFAAGSPVVSSSKGAEGIDARDGCQLLVRDDPAAMAAAVITLWDDSELRNRLVASALELVESHYSWSAAATRIAASLGGPVKKGSVLPV